MRNKYAKILVRIVGLILIISVASKLVDYAAGKVLNSYNKKRILLEQQSDQIEVLILGSSQALYGIDPSYLGRPAFNLANVSQSIDYDLALSRRYADQLTEVKVVFLTISYWSLDHQLADGKENWRSHYYYHYLDVSTESTDYLDLRHYSLVALLGPEKVREYALQGFKVDLVPDLQSDGFISKPYDPNSKRLTLKTGIERVALHDSVRKPESFPVVCKKLEELISIWNERGATVVLLASPVHTAYVQNCNQEVIDRNNKYLFALNQRFNCSYWDFSGNKEFSDADFYDTDHLNINGAIKFSTMLKDSVLTSDLVSIETNKTGNR